MPPGPFDFLAEWALQVALVDIEARGWSYAGPLPGELLVTLAADLKLPSPSLTGHVRIDLRLQSISGRRGESPQRIAVTGEASLEGELVCSACTGPARARIDAPLDVAMVPLGHEPAPLPGGELTDDAVELYTFQGDKVCLQQVLHDEIVLAVPARVLCRPGCLGLCAGCGIDLNQANGSHACQARRPSGPLAGLAQFRSALERKAGEK